VISMRKCKSSKF